MSLLAALLFNDNSDDYSMELFRARTKKIVTLSNVIASSSNIVATAISKDVKRLDIGGLAITLSRLFNDALFINKLKYEYLNSEVSKIYESWRVGRFAATCLSCINKDCRSVFPSRICI